MPPWYTSDLCATAMLEQERAAQGMGEPYAIALVWRILNDKMPAGAFRPITATPRERCDVALGVIEQGAK